MKTRFDVDDYENRKFKLHNKILVLILVGLLFGSVGTSALAYHAASVSSRIGSDGRGGYLAIVKGRNVHYSEPDANESYFKAVLSDSRSKQKVISGRKYFRNGKYATAYSPEAAWKYEYLSAYLQQ